MLGKQTCCCSCCGGNWTLTAWNEEWIVELKVAKTAWKQVSTEWWVQRMD